MSEKISDARFLHYFEKKVRDTIREYNLIKDSSKGAVAVSGGKDSTVCIYVLKKLGYEVAGITIDVAIGNYTKENLENIQGFCKKHAIKLHVISFRKEFGYSLCYLRNMLNAKGYKCSSCMLCGILKRYLLNKYARKWGYEFIATGHNLDDEAQAVLMNVLRNDAGRFCRSGPVSGRAGSKRFVPRIKPLYQVREEEVIRYSKLMKFPVNYGICPCSEKAYRRQFINFLDQFEKKHPSVKYNIISFHEKIKSLIKTDKKEEIPLCELCGEPSSKSVCKRCEIFRQLDLRNKDMKK